MAELMGYLLLESTHYWTAFGLYLFAVVVLLGARTWRHYRATGSPGFNGFRERGMVARVAGIGFALALVSGIAAPLLAARGVLPVLWTSLPRFLGVGFLIGAVAALDGLILAVRAQKTMGASWRIGVDASERTELVTDGAFAKIRNPIFTGLIIIQGGTALMYPTWLGIVGVGLMIVACELQVRLVEEPYLRSVHPSSYPGYVIRTGRFVPLLGGRADPIDEGSS